MHANNRFDGKTIIVTGAAGGIGSATVRLLVSEGAQVVCADRSSDDLTNLVAEMKATGGAALEVPGDVTDPEYATILANKTLEAFGRIDGIYVNAGIAGDGEMAGEITDDSWRRMMSINLDGAFFSARAVLPQMLAQQSGSIVFQASVVSIAGMRGTVGYTAAKTALTGLTRQMAVDYAAQGIRVNAVSPGTVPTALLMGLYETRAKTRGTTAEGDLAETMSKYPMQRVAQPEEVANVAMFLLSDQSSFVTGQNIAVDGGFTAA